MSMPIVKQDVSIGPMVVRRSGSRSRSHLRPGYRLSGEGIASRHADRPLRFERACPGFANTSFGPRVEGDRRFNAQFQPWRCGHVLWGFGLEPLLQVALAMAGPHPFRQGALHAQFTDAAIAFP